MRIKYTRLVTIFILTANIALVFLTWKYLNVWSSKISIAPTRMTDTHRVRDHAAAANRYIRKTLTIVFREFHPFDNDLKYSIENILAIVPKVQILIICDDIPYPPLELSLNATHSSVHMISLGFDVTKSVREMAVLDMIKTRFTLFLPDSVRISGRGMLSKMLREVNANVNHKKSKPIKKSGERNTKTFTDSAKKSQKIAVIPFASNKKVSPNCVRLAVDMPNWTLEYTAHRNRCELFLQKHAVLVPTVFLYDMPDALAQPFPEMFYVQAKLLQLKMIVLNLTIQDGKRLFTTFHTKQRRTEILRQQRKHMFRKLNVKKVIRHMPSKLRNTLAEPVRNAKTSVHKLSVSTNVTWPLTTEITFYGCERTTKSCIGSVHNNIPFYVYIGRHTPPCCRDKLTSVFQHVLDELETVGIRYWLDNTALSNVIETNDLAPDAYEIDISFNRFDLERSTILKRAQSRPIVDDAGMFWIKATDGHYFRVQYSKQNQIGVNLLPFNLNGELVKPDGFYGWKAREFNVKYLHPMSTVHLFGKAVMCPNNVREFLELKTKHGVN